ncbi:MAG: histidine kinase [Alteromonadaceae bacterium]|nr:MAG: histidine kinase [Alteromonadaceae bacterium]
MIGGGFKAIRSVFNYARAIGPLKLYQSLRSKNACKACAFGTGGQNGGWYNETKKGLEFCNKNIQAHVSDIRPAIANTLFFERPISELAQLSGKALEDLGRLATPLYKQAGDSHYSPVSYEKAIELVSDKLLNTPPARSFFYASGRSSNEAVFCLQLLARLYGTNNINNCSYYCHQASGVGLTETIGTGTATVEYDDIGKADCIFVFGANPASNHPRFVKTLLKCRRRGGQVIVINPIKEPGMVKFASPSDWQSMLKGGEAVASEYLQIRIGGDIALMQGVLKSLIEKDAVDQEFIRQFTEGFDDYQQVISQLDWQDIVNSAGVNQAQIEKLATIYSQAKNAIFSWSMGLTHHTHGVGNIHSLVALALSRGMIGRPGAGLLPLRGHSNIQGTGSMGFTPALKAQAEKQLKAAVQCELPQTPGLDTMACIQASKQGNMDFAFLLGGNLLASNPDTSFATEALNNIPFKCFINSTLNTGHVQSVNQECLILPIRVRDEEQQTTTQESMFNFVRRSDGGINRFPQLRAESDLICSIAERVIPTEHFDFKPLRQHQTVRELIAKVVPGFRKLGKGESNKEEFHIDGRILHQPRFATPNQLAKFIHHPLPSWQHDTFYLTSVRSEGQFNSIIYHEEDSYRGQTSRKVVLMHPDDIRQQGLQSGQRVSVQSEVGIIMDLKLRPFDIHRGNVMMYYPEANRLIPTHIDQSSKTPSFKSVRVQVLRYA